MSDKINMELEALIIIKEALNDSFEKGVFNLGKSIQVVNSIQIIEKLVNKNIADQK